MGARDTHTRKRKHREAGADTEGCSVLGCSSVHSQSSVLVCRGRFRILCGHFPSFLPAVSPGDTPARESQEAESCKGHLMALQPTPSFRVRNGRLREGSDSQEVTQQGPGNHPEAPVPALGSYSSCQLPPLPAEQNVRRDLVLDYL